MDANRARFHALWGHAGDWKPLVKTAAHVEEHDDTLRLLSQTPAFKNVATITLDPGARRGAARDRFGNWYWVAPSQRELLVWSSGSGAVTTFWPFAPTARPGPFAPVGAPALAGQLAGAAVTRHHILVVGALDPPGLLAFDLSGGGPPRRVAAPAGVKFEPFDIAALGDGVVVLDRTNRTTWAFDRDLIPRPVAAKKEIDDPFQPVTTRTGRKRDVSSPNASVLLPAGWPAPLAVEAVSCDAAWVLHEADANPATSTTPKTAKEGSLLAKVDWSAPVTVTSVPAFGARTNSALKVRDQNDQEQNVAGHDFAFVAPDRFEVALANGAQAIAFNPKTLKEYSDFIPLRRFGGMAYVGTAFGDESGARPGYDSAGAWASAAIMPRPQFEQSAELVLPGPNGWDSKTTGCVWHRVFIDACVPPNCSIRLRAEVREDPSKDWTHAGGNLTYLVPVADVDGARWQPDPRRRAEGSELPFAPALPDGFDTFETLLHGARGRYLKLTLQLTGDGKRSPRVRAVRAWYPRFSYVEHYLPAIYRDNASSADFLERFLANAEGTLTGIEDRIVAARALVDPRTAPAEALDWLTGWLGLAASPAWDAARKRAFLRHAPEILRRRGTVRGIQWALHLALDKSLDERIFSEPRTDTSPYRIVETFRRRFAPAVALGDPTALGQPRRPDPGASGSTKDRWTPGTDPRGLNDEYTNQLKSPTPVLFPICRPTTPNEVAAWTATARMKLGFIPLAVPGDRDHEERWAAFLRRRYRTDNPPGIPLPMDFPSGGADVVRTAADWYAFESVVMAALVAAHRFEVLIPTVSGTRLTASPSPADLEQSRLRRDLAVQVVRLEAPAHCRFEVRLYASAFRVSGSRVGADSVLGLGSRSPDLYDETVLDGAFMGEAFLHARPPLDAPGLTVLGQTPTFRARAAHGASPR